MSYSLQHQAEILQDRFGARLAARLSDSTDALPYDIAERLRAARVQALGRRKLSSVQTAPVLVSGGGAATLGMGGDDSWNLWGRIAAVLPMVALVVGIVAIKVVQDDARASELAEVDVALLTDNLPPSAYTDPGFLQFLRVGAAESRPDADE
ncbi:MAG TPA: DUF3619 family protein [Burkholderiaceae bacterium]